MVEIGEGGFGKAYKAMHKTSRNTVVLKVLKKAEGVEETTAIEIRVQTKARHRFVMCLDGFFEDKKRIYLVMPYAANGDLKSYLHMKKPLDEQEASRIIWQLSEALVFCHDKNIIHRDVKPANILLDFAFSVKLADFGCSVETLVPRSTLVGTPLYLSPEIMKNNCLYSRSVDAWGVGVVCFELVSGVTPFENWDNPLVMMENIENCTYTMPSFFSNELRDLIRRLLVPLTSQRLSLYRVLMHNWIRPYRTSNYKTIDVMNNKDIKLCLKNYMIAQFGSADDYVIMNIMDDFYHYNSVVSVNILLRKAPGIKKTSLALSYNLCRFLVNPKGE